MNDGNTENLDRTRQGTEVIGNLNIEWQAVRTSASGWHVRCLLQLGLAGTALELSDDEPRQDFDLHSEGESVWGSLQLTSNGQATVLSIDYHSGGTSDEVTTLCAWRVCRACDHVPPSHGSGFIGTWLKANWTVTGSQDACQKIELRLDTVDGTPIGHSALTPQHPEWSQVVRHRGAYAELLFVQRFRQDGRILVEAHLRQAQSPGQHMRLAILPGSTPIPTPPPVPGPGIGNRPGNTLVLSQPRSFASFSYPRALQPPSPNQLGRRFFEIANDGTLQTKLAALHDQKNRSGMLAEAQDFVSPESKVYPGQFVFRIASLQGAMARLHGPAVRAFLASRPETLQALNTEMEALLGEPVATFLQDPNYAPQLARLQDSLVALIVLGCRIGHHEAVLIRALTVCHVAVWLDKHLQVPAPSHAPTPIHLREVLQANALLPGDILPLPDPPAAGTVSPLGYADIKLIRQRLKRYRLGELAHVENVMRGETKEETQRHSRQTEAQLSDTRLHHDSDRRRFAYEGSDNQADASASNPINDLKREFDNLQKQYASDGLSVTVSGGWTDTVDGPATLDDSAASHARRLLDRAASRMARRIGHVRRQRTLEEFSEQKQRRFNNENGSGPLIGLYYWIDEVHLAQLEHVGSRLILECTLTDPSADFVQRSNALHGINLAIPVPPWQASGGVGPIASANDITRANYLALAGRYGTDVRPPPPAQRIANASLGSDPPHPIAMLTVPDGYLAASANIAYAWSTPPATGGQGGTPATPTFDVLVGDAAQKIDTTSDPNPGSKAIAAIQATDGAVPVSIVASGLAYAVNVGLVCQCPDDSPLFRQWQIDTYAAIMAAYQRQKEQANIVLGQLAEEFIRPGNDGRRETERSELRQGAIQALIAPFLALDSIPTPTPTPTPAPINPDRIEFDLIPFFRQAIEWPEMSFTYYGRYSADSQDDWLGMAQTVGRDDGFHEFLQAGSAKLLMPVNPAYVLPMLFYLSAPGQFWFGAPTLCPVFERDTGLVNEMKTLIHQPIPLGPVESWEIEVATSMMMLGQDGDRYGFDLDPSLPGGGDIDAV